MKVKSSSTSPLASPTFCPDALSYPPFVPQGGILSVHGLKPCAGPPRSTVTVTLEFANNTPSPLHVRLVLFGQPLATGVRQLFDHQGGLWEVSSEIPDDCPMDTVLPLVVEALTNSGEVIAQAPCGIFRVTSHLKTPRKRARSIGDQDGRIEGRSVIPRTTTHALMRTTQFHDTAPESRRLQATLDILTPLEPFAQKWTEEEKSVGRRLLRFNRAQNGHRVQITCRVIPQEMYASTDIVVSCIYRPETRACYITSVDLLHLLEGLADQDFSIEEKNRIRRNLEGFRPMTISRRKANFAQFFQKIMDFPAPKPRTIEKDLKIFEWEALSPALEKIMSKYSFGEVQPGYEDQFMHIPSDAPSPSSSSSTSAFDKMPRLVMDEPRDVRQSSEEPQSAVTTTFDPRPFDFPPFVAEPSWFPTSQSHDLVATSAGPIRMDGSPASSSLVGALDTHLATNGLVAPLHTSFYDLNAAANPIGYPIIPQTAMQLSYMANAAEQMNIHAGQSFYQTTSADEHMMSMDSAEFKSALQKYVNTNELEQQSAMPFM